MGTGLILLNKLGINKFCSFVIKYIQVYMEEQLDSGVIMNELSSSLRISFFYSEKFSALNIAHKFLVN